jgi:TolA-binding protein
VRGDRVRPWAALSIVALGLLGSGCAYFNTFYSARKSFDAAEKLYRNPDDRASSQQITLYDQALKSSTKLFVTYPKSKWIDDAVLLMGRSLLGKGEFDKARIKFQELATNFPQSPLLDQALFYTAESYRRERKWELATFYIDSLGRVFPKSKLLPLAQLRRGQVLLAQSQFRDAATVLARVPSHGFEERRELETHRALADAYFSIPAYDSARVEYEWVMRHTKELDRAHEALLRQGDCLEGMRAYDRAIRLYEDYERQTKSPDYRDQVVIRRAYVLALAGKENESLALLDRIVTDQARPAAAPDALFKIGYIQEVLIEDLPAARQTYAKIMEQYRGSQVARQAETRSGNLDKIEALRAAAASDTTGREQAAAAAFAVAERILVDAERPERAVEEYARVESSFALTQVAPKAAYAAAWVLSKKLARSASADSAWRRLMQRYPETPFGRAASAIVRGKADSLRTGEPLVPTMVRFPYSPNATLYVPPETNLKSALAKSRDEAATAKARAAAIDSLRRAAVVDTTRRVTPPDTTRQVAPPDTTSRAAPPDTTRAPADTTRRGTSAGTASGRDR